MSGWPCVVAGRSDAWCRVKQLSATPRVVSVVGSAYPGRHGSRARLLRRGPARQARRELDENAAESGYDGEAYTANDLRTLAGAAPGAAPSTAVRTQDPDDRFFQATSAARSYGTGMDIQFVASIAVITP